MNPTTEAEAKAYVEQLSEYESQGYNLVRLRAARESMLENLKKAALAIDIKNFRNALYPPILDKTPLAELMQFYYSDVMSVEDWAVHEIKALLMSIDADTKYIDGIKKKKKLSAADKKTISFWGPSIVNDQAKILEIKNAIMARKKNVAPVKQEEPKKLSQAEMLREAVITSLGEHADLIKGILEDYLVTDGAELEIAQVLTNMVIAIKMIKIEEEENKGLTPKQVVDLADYLYNASEIDANDLLKFMVDSEIIDYIKDRSFAFVKLPTMEQRNKFLAFAETELWPDYNQQRENIIL